MVKIQAFPMRAYRSIIFIIMLFSSITPPIRPAVNTNTFRHFCFFFFFTNFSNSLRSATQLLLNTPSHQTNQTRRFYFFHSRSTTTVGRSIRTCIIIIIHTQSLSETRGTYHITILCFKHFTKHPLRVNAQKLFDFPLYGHYSSERTYVPILLRSKKQYLFRYPRARSHT